MNTKRSGLGSVHLLLERLAVVLLRLGADVAAGREHVAVLAYLVQLRALAEAGHVGVLAGLRLAAPGVVGVGDAGDVLVGQLAVGAVHHAAELAGVDEEHWPRRSRNLPFLRSRARNHRQTGICVE
jgi:hypothetical protein